jgi:cysteinyl-tRNA synthetase
MSDEEQAAFEKTAEYVSGFETAMEDDFNTADAVSSVFELVKYANTTANADSSKEYLGKLLERITKLTDVLGLIVEKEEELLAEDIEKLIAERQAARKERNFQRADEIRNELLEKGIILEDTREGVKWRKA